MKIHGQDIPRACRKVVEGFGEGGSALNNERNRRGLSNGVRDFQPGGILSQKEAPERMVGHRSC